MGRPPEDDDRAVVHRVLEHRPGEDDPVEEGDRETRRDPPRELAERPARSRAVDVDVVADAGVQRRDHERLAVGDEAEVGDEPGVQDGVDRLAVVPAPLGKPAHAGAPRSCSRVIRRHPARVVRRAALPAGAEEPIVAPFARRWAIAARHD